MKHAILTTSVLFALAAVAFGDVDKEELKKLSLAGMSDELILSYARAKGPVARLSADDVVELKKVGLSDGLLANLMALQGPPPAVQAPGVPASTSQAIAKLLADPSIVYDGRYFYPRSYFSSDHAAYSSAGIGITVAAGDPRWIPGPYGRPSYSWGWSVYGRGYSSCGSGGRRACVR